MEIRISYELWVWQAMAGLHICTFCGISLLLSPFIIIMFGLCKTQFHKLQLCWFDFGSYFFEYDAQTKRHSLNNYHAYCHWYFFLYLLYPSSKFQGFMCFFFLFFFIIFKMLVCSTFSKQKLNSMCVHLRVLCAPYLYTLCHRLSSSFCHLFKLK